MGLNCSVVFSISEEMVFIVCVAIYSTVGSDSSFILMAIVLGFSESSILGQVFLFHVNRGPFSDASCSVFFELFLLWL